MALVCTSAISCSELGWNHGHSSDQVCAESDFDYNASFGVCGDNVYGCVTCFGGDNTPTDGFVEAGAICEAAGARRARKVATRRIITMAPRVEKWCIKNSAHVSGSTVLLFYM